MSIILCAICWHSLARLSETQGKLAALEETYSAAKRENADEIHKLKIELETRDALIAKTSKETEITKTENHKLTDFIKDQERWDHRQYTMFVIKGSATICSHNT